MLDQDNNFYLISLNILITCLLDNTNKKWFWKAFHYKKLRENIS